MFGIERHHHHGDEDDPCGSHDHAMVFHSCVCAEILFRGWSTSSELQLFGSALVLFAAAALYEGLKRARGAQQLASSEHGVKSLWSRAHALQTALHGAQATVSYLLMLVFMTYNVWLCLALVLGLTAGYFAFGGRAPPPAPASSAADHKPSAAL